GNDLRRTCPGAAGGAARQMGPQTAAPKMRGDPDPGFQTTPPGGHTMSIKLSVPQTQELKPRITVFGVGGAGGNAVNNMIEAGLEGVDFVVANTDAQALALSSAERRIQLGASITEGLGAGSRPEVGCAAAEEALHEIVEH